MHGGGVHMKEDFKQGTAEKITFVKGRGTKTFPSKFDINGICYVAKCSLVLKIQPIFGEHAPRLHCF